MSPCSPREVFSQRYRVVCRGSLGASGVHYTEMEVEAADLYDAVALATLRVDADLEPISVAAIDA